jgi:hypothetical protein
MGEDRGDGTVQGLGPTEVNVLKPIAESVELRAGSMELRRGDRGIPPGVGVAGGSGSSASH